jgi:predicted nucleic acid-binding protein
MKPIVYIETTIVSYLTAWPSRDVVRLAQQQQTHEWWDTQRGRFELVCSEVVEREAAAGDPLAAAERIKVIRTIQMLAIAPKTDVLAADLVAKVRLPSRARTDALHVAIAATNGVDYLLTWNCRHLTNAVFRPRIERVCRDNGLEPPTICTPADLMEMP